MASSPTTDASERDDRALELRTSGQSFVAIARELGYERALQANEGFQRALRRRPARERRKLRDQELARLDAMAARARAAEAGEPEDMARRLRAVERLRERLLAD